MAPGVAQDGATSLVRTLQRAGVKVVFANPGTTEMRLVGALDAVGGGDRGVRAVLGLHETVVTGAADGYARLADDDHDVPVALLHLGPGLANGLCNLHNAHKAGSGVLTVVGDMARYHQGAGAPLEMDIVALAKTVGYAVETPQSVGDLPRAALRLLRAIRAPRGCESVGCGRSRVATLICPHDLQWEPIADAPVLVEEEEDGGEDAALEAFAEDCARSVVETTKSGGLVGVYCGGSALRGDALRAAGELAAAVGGELLCENAFARLDRGGGLPLPKRLPYFPKDAQRELSRFDALVVVDAPRPVATFGYESPTISRLDDHLPEETKVWQLEGVADVAGAIRTLIAKIPKDAARNAGPKPVPPPARSTFPPETRLTPAVLCTCVAKHQPADVVVIDESLTSGTTYWEAAAALSPPFTHCTLTGGAIGSGPPLAVGAAVACPSRRVINFQADGSAMYSLQALWTQAREKLDVVTVICANRTYQILKLELGLQGVRSGEVARSLTDLREPEIDFVALATGYGVPASRATTSGELEDQLKKALSRPGPSLIEAVLA